MKLQSADTTEIKIEGLERPIVVTITERKDNRVARLAGLVRLLFGIIARRKAVAQEKKKEEEKKEEEKKEEKEEKRKEKMEEKNEKKVEEECVAGIIMLEVLLMLLTIGFIIGYVSATRCLILR